MSMGILERRIQKRGHSSVVYYLPKRILSLDPNFTLKMFEAVNIQIRSEITKLKIKYNFKRVDLIGISLGGVSTYQVYSNNQDISNIFSIDPGSCLASCVWDGIRTQKFRKAYEKKGISKRKLQNIWKSISPKNNVEKNGCNNFFLALYRSDIVIPYKYGKIMVNAISKKKTNVVIKENRFLGHYLTVLKYCLFSDELLK